MRTYRPDRWVVVKITSKTDTVYKVFGVWSGGYLDGDSWKLNSGISDIEESETNTSFIGYSGSVYECNPNSYGTNGYGAAILSSWVNDTSDQVGVKVFESFDEFKREYSSED